MSYIKCPTCQKDISNRTTFFDEKKREIDLMDIDDDVKNKKITELYEKLKFTRYCCNTRFVMRKEMIDIIL